jgi:dihydrofolate synthase/folylpolyglutamate synthase
MATLKVLRRLKMFRVPLEQADRGFFFVAENTGLRGRWEVLGKQPTMVCDVAHNAHGLRPAMAQLARESAGKQLHIVFGMVKDKDISAALALLPRNAQYYFTQAASPRALPVEELAEWCCTVGLQGRSFPTVAAALTAVKQAAAAEDYIYIGGSCYVVGEAIGGSAGSNGAQTLVMR